MLTGFLLQKERIWFVRLIDRRGKNYDCRMVKQIRSFENVSTLAGRFLCVCASKPCWIKPKLKYAHGNRYIVILKWSGSKCKDQKCFSTFRYASYLRTASKDWLEHLSVYDVEKHPQSPLWVAFLWMSPLSKPTYLTELLFSNNRAQIHETDVKLSWKWFDGGVYIYEADTKCV